MSQIGFRFHRIHVHQVCVAVMLSVVLLGAHRKYAAADDLQDALAREIIGPKRSLEQTQAYCEKGVAVLPTFNTVAEWDAYATELRKKVLDTVVFRGEAAAWRGAPPAVEWLDTIAGGPGYKIKKLRFEALPGLWIPALLYEPEQLEGKVAVMLNVNGHDPNGKAAVYKQMRCINMAKRGMIALNLEWLGMGQLQGDGYAHYRMNQIDLCGTSGLSVFFLAMQRGLDVLLDHPNADASRVGVAGLSGGGWQTIILSSLDTRVTLCNPVAGYSSLRTRARFFQDLGDSEQTPVDLAGTADYDHLTAMLAPRAALLTYNLNDDCCFKADHALPPLLKAARPVFQLYGKDQFLSSHVNVEPGNHNFEMDNRQHLYAWLGEHFFAGAQSFSAKEIDSSQEIKTAEELNVEVPPGNADFHTIALRLAETLPKEPNLPMEAGGAEQWQNTARLRLSQVVRARDYMVNATQVASEEKEGIKITWWQLGLSDTWTIPMVEFSPANPNGITLLVADAGRASLTDRVRETLAQGRRVLAVDPFYIGESRLEQRDFLFALFISSIGDRPVGLQASQLAAVCRHARSHYQVTDLTLAALGPRSSLAALVAAGLQPDLVSSVELTDSLGSLRQVIDDNLGVNDAPEYFCFGLLAEFDIRQLVGLVAPRPVQFNRASERVIKEMAGLDAWYTLRNGQFPAPKPAAN